MVKKLLIIGSVIASFGVSSAFAGVSRIYSNGSKGYRVECSSGSDYIIYRSSGSWYRGGSGHMGNKYDSWSKNDVANYLCN